jgi:hypothetical protein
MAFWNGQKKLVAGCCTLVLLLLLVLELGLTPAPAIQSIQRAATSNQLFSNAGTASAR